MKIALLGGSFNPVHKGHLALAESVVKLAGYDKVVFVPAYQSPFKSRWGKGVVSVSSGAATSSSGKVVAQSQTSDSAAILTFSDEERIDMLRLAIAPYPWGELELCEIERGGVSYTIDTVRFLTEKYRTEGLLLENGRQASKADGDSSAAERGFLDGKLGIIIGADLIAGFPRWKEAEALSREADIIVARRPESLKVEGCHYSEGASENGTGCRVQSASDTEPAGNAAFAYPHVSIMNELYDISSTEIRRRIALHEDISALIPEEICRYIKQRGVYDS